MEKETIHIATIDVDRDTLFGELDSVIQYLSKIRAQYKNGEDIYLDEGWSGYEDNYFDITVSRLETDEECKARIDRESRKQLRLVEEQRQKEAKAEQKRKEKIQQQIETLKKQL